MKILLLIISIFVSNLSYSQETYTIGNTEYYSNQYYSKSGKPIVKRSEKNKKTFLDALGYSETPNGYQIDHIIPLSEGGSDDPRNMQLLTISQHKQKTANERANRGNSSSTYSSVNTYFKNSTSNSFYEEPITTVDYSRSENGRIIYKGTSGGEYYINDNGNKTYVKSKLSKTPSTNYLSSPSNTSSYSFNTYSKPSSSMPREIQIGSRGGQYYINSSGKKTYIKK